METLYLLKVDHNQSVHQKYRNVYAFITPEGFDSLHLVNVKVMINGGEK